MKSIISKDDFIERFQLQKNVFDDIEFDVFMDFLNIDSEHLDLISPEYVLSELRVYKEIPEEKRTYEDISIIKHKVEKGEIPVDYTYYHLLDHNENTKLENEDLNNLSVIIWYSMYFDDSYAHILDFYRGLCFASRNPRGLFWSTNASGVVDEHIKEKVIDLLKLIVALTQNYTDSDCGLSSSDSGQKPLVLDSGISKLVLKFENGDVVNIPMKTHDNSNKSYGIYHDLIEYIKLISGSIG